MKIFALCLLICAISFTPAHSEQLLRRAVNNTISTNFDPQKVSGNTHRLILADMFLGLTTMDRDGNTVAGAAESWTISPDGKSYAFTLRDDIYWHDGKPVIAEDFALGLHRLFALGKEARLVGHFQIIENSENLAQNPLPIRISALKKSQSGIIIKGNKSLEIQLTKPLAFFLDLLSTSQAYPVPSHLYETMGEDWSTVAQNVTNGPYRLDSYTDNNHLILAKASNFYDSENVFIDKVHYVKLPAGSTPARMTLNGFADISAQLPSFQVEATKQLDDYILYQHNRLIALGLLLNHNVEPLRDIRIRKALYLGINRGTLISTLSSLPTPLAGLVPSFEGYISPAKIGNEEPNLEMAQALMRDAGYSENNKLKLELKINDTVQSYRIGTLAKRQWAKIYVDLTFTQMPFPELLKNLYSSNFQVIRRSWVADVADPTDFLNIYTHRHNPQLYTNQDEALQNLLDHANNSRVRRNEILQRAEQHILDNYYSVPLFNPAVYYLVSKRVKGWSTAPKSRQNTRWLSLQN